MKLTQILSAASDSWETTTRVLENPKVATVTASYSFAVGFIGAAFDLFRDGLPFLGMLAGFITALLTIRARLRRDKIDLIEIDTAQWRNREARERVLRMPGVETRKEDHEAEHSFYVGRADDVPDRRAPGHH